MDSDTHSVATSRSDVDSDSYFQELDDDQLFQKLNELMLVPQHLFKSCNYIYLVFP